MGEHMAIDENKSNIFEGLNLEPQPVDFLQLDHIVTIGRRFFEYNDIFLLEELNPAEIKILDVGGGVSSFAFEASVRGFEVLSADPLYTFEHSSLKRKCEDDIEYTINSVQKSAHKLKWGHPFRDFDHLREVRRSSYELFLDDFKANRWRYIDAKFPYTPFIAHNNFSISLVSHLLFIYEHHIDYETHVRILKEILRVTSGEVRIYPLINLQFKVSVFVERIMNDPVFKRVSFELRPVRYNFLSGADHMMVIKKGNPLR
jgi:hypothetical protein